ncbi:MAG: leucine-rich repeat domain-containing protein [Bacteroidetes bacterium]|nr:leucine-rich repeat domain-containing protein [Bacteroidota bacterium]MCL1968215.1 leucine-rich repeat domain-containing protein [Bacteroidota bacterium]
MKHFKSKIIFVLALTLLASTCEPKPGETKNIITVITAAIKNVTLEVKGSGDMTIDWGDGSAIDTVTLSDTTIISRHHDYAYEKANKITITGNVTYLYSNYNNVTNLDITKTTVITTLYCGNNRISSLDAGKCKALKYLDCSDNSFSTTALDELFGTLPMSSIVKTVEIFSNPGCEDCDRSIAQKKGWYVGDCW